MSRKKKKQSSTRKGKGSRTTLPQCKSRPIGHMCKPTSKLNGKPICSWCGRGFPAPQKPSNSRGHLISEEVYVGPNILNNTEIRKWLIQELRK